MIGNCDCCDRTNVPVSKVNVPGEPSACFLCQGDTDPDPYGEMTEAVEETTMVDARRLADRIELHLNVNTTATLVLTEDDFRAAVAALRSQPIPPGANPPRVEPRRDIWMDGYWKALNENLPVAETTDAKHQWRKAAYERHQAEPGPFQERST